MLRVEGTPIGGEDRRTPAWRAFVADAARPLGLTNVASVSLAFTLEPGRRVDVDNLARPALEGLRDAGWFSTGFKSLDRLVVTKGFGADVGLVVDANIDAPALVEGADFQTEMKGVIPTEGAHDVKRLWRDAVRSKWGKPPMGSDVVVELGFNTRLWAMDDSTKEGNER